MTTTHANTGIGLPHGVKRFGAPLSENGRGKVLILFASTPTERGVLTSFVEETYGARNDAHAPRIAWVAENKSGDGLILRG